MGDQRASERGALRKDPGGKLRVALVYPNAYRLGMANLGVHAVYRLVNASPAALCERAFLDGEGEPRAVESGRPLREFDAVAFSLSFEEDYPNVLAILSRAGLPLRSAARDERHPLVVAGGIAVQINPEPMAPFVDAFLVGEAEALLPPFLDLARGALPSSPGSRADLLRSLSRLPGGYVPSLYDVEYASTRAPAGRWVTRLAPREGAPAPVRRAFLPDLRGVATSRAVDSPDAQFGDLHLTEVARGCLWGCRFCAAGFVQRPYREVDLATLREEARKGMARGQRVGLVGPDVSDHGSLDALTGLIAAEGGAFSPSSLRVEAITPELSRRMAQGGERSVTLAPEAGTERLRRVVNKAFGNDDVVRAAQNALSAGMQHVKMYFMCGLPTETEDDVLGIARLALRVREEAMLPRARRSKRMGRIGLSVTPFVPKPWTPFQWAPMEGRAALEGKRRLLARALGPKGIDVEFASPRDAELQALLSRGDRRCADLLEIAQLEAGGDLRRALRRWPEDPDFFVRREVDPGEALPWDVVDPGVGKAFLAREYRRGLAGKITPRCAVATCRACGLECADRPEIGPAAPRE